MSVTYAYVLNSTHSDTGMNMATTSPNCYQSIGGLTNVCYYDADVLPNTYRAFPVAADTTFVVTATGRESPTASWSPLTTCEVTMNAVTGELSIRPWAGPPPSDVAEGGHPAEHPGGKRPVRQGSLGAAAGVAPTAG